MSASRGAGRVFAYAWAFPNTLLGIVLAVCALCTGGRGALREGVVEVHGGSASFLLRRLVPLAGGASAMTVGHVVLGRDPESLARTRAHERVHVGQYGKWGPFFLPAYFAASIACALRGRHYYRDNCFEHAARAAETGRPR